MKSGRLKYPYIAVTEAGKLSYGGNQSWYKGRVIQRYGCGAVAGTDLLLYLSLHKEYCRGKEFLEISGENGILDTEQYLENFQKMKRRYFPVIPGFGMPGWLLASGVNRYFRRNRIPLKASFGVLGRNMGSRTGAMLAHDIPVILAIGPNFPVPVKKYKVTFYQKVGEEYNAACETAAHFVTVTAMEGDWMKVSSWGKEYYINVKEYENYVKKHSCFLVSNLLYIRKK